MSLSAVKYLWSQGAGINLSVCGYTNQQTIILEFNHVGYLEVYGRVHPEDVFVNEGIAFTNNAGDVDALLPPLLQLLALLHGCRIGTMELLWKYYRTLALSHQRREQRRLSMPADTSRLLHTSSAVGDEEEADNHTPILALVLDELHDDSIDRFAAFVDNSYRMCIERECTGFTLLDGYLLDRPIIRQMHEKMKVLFPVVHSVLALTVLHPRAPSSRVVTAYDNPPNGSGGPDCVSFDTVSSVVVDGGCVDRDADDNDSACDDSVLSVEDCGDESDLNKGEQGILEEFFIAMIRLCSQMKMRWWAMIPAIAAYSQGHMHNPPNHPLHSAGCHDITLWSTLDKLYKSTSAARMDVMIQQFSCSFAFDNWQQRSPKTWQNQGSSAIFLNGVAAFIKKNKAILLPVNSIIRSSSNVRFRITSSRFLDPYLILLKGVVIREVGIADDAILPSNLSLSRTADIDRMTSGMLAWLLNGVFAMRNRSLSRRDGRYATARVWNSRGWRMPQSSSMA